jgi:hypothetical protein
VATATRQEEALGAGPSPRWGQSAQNQDARHALANAVAADFAILWIKDELLFSALATALPVAGLVRTHGLLKMKSGRFELFLAETATPLIHPFKVTALPLSFRKVNPASPNWEKIPDRRSLRVCDWRIGRSSAT